MKQGASFTLDCRSYTDLWRVPELAEKSRSIWSDAFLSVISCVDVDVLIEAGAHEAGISQRFAARGGRSLAIEANPVVAEFFMPKMPLGVEYINAAVTSSCGDVMLTVAVSSLGLPTTSSLLQSLKMPKLRNTVNVPGHSVDCFTGLEVCRDSYGAQELAPSSSPLTAIWVDVEGAAGIVLAGSAKTSQSRHIAAMLVECEQQPEWKGQWTESEVRSYLTSRGMILWGYDCQAENQRNLLFVSACLDSPSLELIHQEALRQSEILISRAQRFPYPLLGRLFYLRTQHRVRTRLRKSLARLFRPRGAAQ